MSWLPKKKIVVPVDFSDQSFEAVDTALRMVEKPVDVTVVHVLQKMIATEPGVVWGAIEDATRSAHVKERLGEHFEGEKYQGMKWTVLFGDPGQEIAALAEDLDADLIVLPSHGRTGIRRLLIGSVAERVVRLSHCPVLVMRT